MDLFLIIGAILAGLVGLVWSSDRFVQGAAALAHNSGISHLVIGLTIVAFGTSAPEILVSSMAALEGAVDLAAGNALGSNIANIGLVLGITALLVALPVSKAVFGREIWIMLAFTGLIALFLMDLHVSRFEGISLLILLCTYLGALFYVSRHEGKEDAGEEEEEIPTDMSNKKAYVNFGVGLVLLLISAQVLVWGATNLAQMFGVPELIIGATIVAIGTSLPELATSIVAAIKRHYDIVLGNIIGSNIFNIAAVLAVAGIINPSSLPGDVMARDMLFVGVTSVLLGVAIVASKFGKKAMRLPRVFGLIFLIVYAGYLFMNFQALMT